MGGADRRKEVEARRNEATKAANNIERKKGKGKQPDERNVLECRFGRRIRAFVRIGIVVLGQKQNKKNQQSFLT